MELTHVMTNERNNIHSIPNTALSNDVIYTVFAPFVQDVPKLDMINFSSI